MMGKNKGNCNSPLLMPFACSALCLVRLTQSLDTHFGQVLAVCEHVRMIDLEVLGRLLAASAVQIAQKRELARTRRRLASQTAEKATTYMLDQTYKAPLRNRTDSPMLPDQVAAWAAAGESETLELKRSTGQRREAAKSICAMLNHRGGRVLFGVEPNGQVVGQEVGDRTLTDIAEEIAEIDPPAFPSIDRVDLGTGRQVLIVSVLTGQNRPYSYRGQAYRRVGATDRAMSRAEYNRLLLEQVHSEHRWENESASGWTVADLNQTEIVRTVEEAIRRGRAEDLGTRDPVELLRGLGLLHEDRLLRAAVVLFGRAERLEMFYPQCLLRVARFRGVDRTEFLDNRQMFGNAFDLLRKAELFLRENLPIAGRITPSLFERLDDPLYPPVVLREALANAFCHRDYSIGGGSVAVAVYDDKLEITSSGALHFGLTAEALFAPHESLPWNPLIARVFYRRGLIEAWGRGTLKMAELIEKAGLPKLAIEDAGGCVTVRFRPPLREEREITQRQREVLAILEQFSTTGLALREILSRLEGGATERQVRADLEILRSAGLAVVEGRGRGARWKCL